MCGIAGYYNYQVTEDQRNKLVKKIGHRGPDGQGSYSNNDVGLLHTRLSIIELSDLGAQPYCFKNLVLVFNGELYNYKEVRETLKAEGYSFQSNSDTEVLITAFHCWREKCVDRFIGMFAFSIYDEQTDELFLFRDRIGVKPLYYSYSNSVLFFASELKALLEFPFDRTIDTDAVSLYFRFGFIPGHLSIFKSAHKLEPAHYIKISRSSIHKQKYWHPSYESVHHRQETDWLEELHELLVSSFTYRMVSDVPVGVFLSGGIDSSLLTAILQKYHGSIHTFTIGFNETEFDESQYAAGVANHLKTNHVEKMLGLSEAKNLLAHFYEIYDEPFADTSGIPTACVTQLAKQHGMKVVLSADGGDELFGGYTHYQKALGLYNTFNRLPESARYLVAKGLRFIFPPGIRNHTQFFNTEHKVYALEELMESKKPVTFFEAFLANQSMDEISRLCRSVGSGSMDFKEHIQDPQQAMMAWDFNYYLPDDLLVKVDRATMHYGMECRDPFLDHRLVEFVAGMPISMKIREGVGKYPLRKLLSRYVPSEYFERKKQGFSIPIFSWFSQELDEMFRMHLSEENLKDIDILNTSEVNREYRKYLTFKKAGKQHNIEKMWRILSFVLWWEKYKRDASH